MLDVEAGINDAYLPMVKCSKSWFFHIWRTHIDLKKVVIRKWLRFSKCDECISLREKLGKTRDPDNIKKIQRQMRDHIDMVKRSRAMYYQRRRLAFEEPDKYLSLIVDGADQAQYKLPYFHQRSKTTDAAYRSRIYLMGVLMHGRAAYGYTFGDNVKQGTNVTIECIQRVLLDMDAKGHKIPKTLFLQLDNTAKQCKNRYLMGYLAYLVQRKIFAKVIVSFLPVGHTHEDIDQFFSRLSVHLRSHDATSITKLHTAVTECYQCKNTGSRPITGNHFFK
jgi:hypothetical protein